MRAADFAAMSDPLNNPQFSRRWLPPPLKRERRPAQAPLPNGIGNSSSTTIDQAARRLKIRWGLA
jgi:hypothetical protein